MGFSRDLRQATRIFSRSPGFAAISVIALALGVGLTTTMFSIVNGALFKGLPFPDSKGILHLERNNLSAGIESMEVTLHDYLDWREQQRAFESLEAYYSGTVNIRGTERAERYSGAFVTAGLFSLLRVEPVLGRGFREGEDTPGAEPVVVLGHRMWQDRYGGDPGVIGTTVWANGEQMTVVGVMPEGFRFPVQEEIWLPNRQDPLELERGAGTTLEVIGRLHDGQGPDQAALEINRIAQLLAEEYPETNEGVGAAVKPFVEEYVDVQAKGLLFAMLGATFLVLLVASANVANLLLARAASRTREVALRTALGASRRAVVSHMLSESLVLSVGGALVGLVIAWFAIASFVAAIESTEPPFWMDFGFDLTVFLFVAGVTLLGAILSGVIPALKATSKNVAGILNDESRGSSGLRIGRLSRILVVSEIALSAGLLVGAGLMVKSMTRIQTLDWGFAQAEVFTARVGLFPTDYPEVSDRIAFFEQLQTRLSELPGVRGAALTTSLPGLGSWGSFAGVQGQSYATDQDYPLIRRQIITPGYFQAFDVDILAGRPFEAQDDTEGMDVALVNQAFADQFFPGGEALGKQVRVGRSDTEEPWRTIVGVVPNLYMGGALNDEDPNGPGIYTPLAQEDARFLSIAVRTDGNPMRLTSLVRETVAGLDGDVPIYWTESMEQSLEESTWPFRIFGTLFAAFGVAALFLASVGLYGVMSFSVRRRTTEVGIRMALGAEPRDVIGMILRQGLWQMGVGLLLGGGVALLVGQGIQLLLFQVDPRDPVIFAAIAALLTCTGLAASYVPAARATRVDPMVAFQAD
jgi:predicted permease